MKKAKSPKAFSAQEKTAKSVPKAAAVTVENVAPTTTATTIVANFDVGFGNSLCIRGTGPGLRWDKGVAMECVADDRWSITLGESAVPFVFKFLINDEVWCTGEDYTVAPGSCVTLVPTF